MAKKKVIGICKLCGQNSQLIHGHVIPKWAGLLSENKSMLKLISLDAKNIPVLEELTEKDTRGMYAEYLFCEPCDNGLGVGEELIKQILHPIPNGKKGIYLNKFQKKNRILIPDSKTRKEFLIAIAGLIYKAAISSGPYTDFKISRKSMRLITNGLKNSSFDAYLRVTIFKLYNLTDYRVSGMAEMIDGSDSPHEIQLITSGVTKNGNQVVFMFGGALFSIFIGKGEGGKMKYLDGKWGIGIGALDIRYLLDDKRILDINNLKALKNRKESERMISKLIFTPLEDTCPCRIPYRNPDGIREIRSFGECCFGYWKFSEFTLSR